MAQRRTPRGGPGGNRRPGERRGAAARPHLAGRRRSRPPATREGRRRPRLTGRAAILVLVVAVLTVSYASSMRAYLQQRAHIGDLKDQIAAREAAIDDLEREKQRWHDPAFVEAQARDRFGYVMPGETSYVVLDEDGDPLEGDQTLPDADRRAAAAADRVVRPGLGLRGARRQPAEGPGARVDVHRPAPALGRGPRRSAAGDRPRRRGGDRGPARTRAARHPRGRAPLPVRQPRRRHHRAAAARTARRSRRRTTSPARARPRGSARSRAPA